MAIPPDLPQALADYLTGVERRLAQLETPMGFVPAFLTKSTSLTTVNAAQAANSWAVLTDLKTFAWSDGVHWRRTDTGAQII